MSRVIILILIFIGLIFLVHPGLPPKLPFRLGLDLLGGAHLVYQAELGDGSQEDRESSMAGIRDVIERRINIFGVAEPNVQLSGEDRLIIELPQVKDVGEAIKLIGETPFLEFRELTEEPDQTATESFNFISTGLTGKQLKRAFLSFDPNTNLPQVALEFNDEGSKLFSEITGRNINNPVAIFLDGEPISVPIVQNEITTGQAVITGRFSINEARELAGRLSSGALPVPIKLIQHQTIGPTLGKESLDRSLKAAVFGLAALILFLIIYYRVFGLIAVLALAFYTVFVLAIFKLIPVTLTLAGIAGFILSLGMAVDGNILIFSRIREELSTYEGSAEGGKQGRSKISAIEAGFRRAWSSIRDSQVTTLIAAVILYIFSTSLVKGFALTLAIGTIFSIFTAVYVTKTFLKSFYK